MGHPPRMGQEWVDWLDGLGPENFECHSVEYTPEVDQTVVITFNAIGSGTAWVGFSFDDFFVIPEPSSIAMLSLGVILALRRQR